MILLRHQNNYIEYLSDNNVLLLQKVNILVISLCALHNYFRRSKEYHFQTCI